MGKRKSNIGFVGLVVCFLLNSFSGHALDGDTVLSASQFLNLVKSYHPVARKTQLLVKLSEAGQLAAKGNFDPVLQGGSGNKTLDGLNYYSTIQTELAIPTWYGIQVNMGVENLQGSRTNPSETKGTLSFAGITVPLAKNLVFDKRRAALQQASQMNLMAVEEQRMILNQLCSEALAAYMEWVQAWQLYQLAERNFKLSESRMTLVRKSFEFGDRASIDTLEAFTLVQQFELLKNQHFLEFIREGIYLSAYLWTESNTPYTLPEGCIPNKQWENYGEEWSNRNNIDSLLDIVYAQHPGLKWYERKINFLQIEKKLKFQDLLPKVDFQYNLLSKKGLNGFYPGNESFSPVNNSYYGFKVQYPLRISEGRANYQAAKIKLQDAGLDLELKKIDLVNKVKKVVNDFVLIDKQVSLQLRYVRNLELLAEAERTKLDLGESSFFLTNSRDNKVIDAQEKLIQLQIKRKISLLQLPYVMGLGEF